MKPVSFYKFFIFSAIFVCSLGLCSLGGCQKAHINGDLDGRWQILEIYPLNEDVKQEQLYYNFYNTVCNLSYYGEIFTEGNMHYDNNTLTLSFPYVSTEEDLQMLFSYGILSNPVEFKVDYLDSKKLILKEGDITITLRKF